MLRLLTCLFCFPASLAQADITVFAAASLRGVLEDLRSATTQDVVISYASSAALARQIAQGAPADVFISANRLWADWLEEEGGTEVYQAEDLLQNSLVLIGTEPDPEFDINILPAILGDEFLAIGHARAVPAGIYAREALTALDLWAGLSGKIIQADNVRAALRLAALGEAPFAVTYATDALADPRVHVLHRFAAEDHSPITYRLAALSDSAEVQSFLAHLQSKPAREIFRAHGFQDVAE